MRTPDRATAIKHRPLSFVFNPYIFVGETEDGFTISSLTWDDTFQYAFSEATGETLYPGHSTCPAMDTARAEAACNWLDNLSAERLYALLMGADKDRPVFK